MDFWLRVAQFVFSVICSLFGIAAFVFAYVGQKERASKQALTELEDKMQARLNAYDTTQKQNHDSNQESMGKINVRMAAIDEKLQHIPTTAHLTSLADSVSRLGNSLAKLEGAQEMNTRSVERMNQYLMERGT